MIKSLNKTLVTYSDIEDIIDECIIYDKPFTFVCDEDLAEYTTCFIKEEYGIEVEDSDLYECDEYYVSFIPGKNDEPAILFCENAIGNNGEYLLDDAYGNYYVFTDMTEEEAKKKLLAGDYGFYELNEECDGDCENCQYEEENNDDEIEEIIQLIENYADAIENDDSECGCFLRNTLLDLFCLGKRIGYQDARDEFRCFLEDTE
jgi:hypothetical protein